FRRALRQYYNKLRLVIEKTQTYFFPITISQAKAAKPPLPAGNGKVEFSQKTVHFKPWNAGYYAAILIA
ncbi:MAG: hypothetical protein WA073_03000, partial [Gemmiger qucibialis]